MNNLIILGIIVIVVGISGLLGVGLTQDRDGLYFYSKNEAYRQGMSAYVANRFDIAIPALKFASEKGKIEADRILAKIYSDETAIDHDNLKAFEHFERYAYHHTDISYLHAYASQVAEAFVELGKYYLNGIPDSRIKSAPEIAVRHFKHAASHLRDTDAYYHLARSYLLGKGVQRNLLTAAKWLKRAYQMNHAAAQAVLGNLFWEGKGVGRNRGLALTLLLLANKNSGDQNCPGFKSSSNRWIGKAYERMAASAGPNLRNLAQTKFEELYHPCHKKKALKPVDGIRIQYDSKKLDQQNKSKGIPAHKLEPQDRKNHLMTFQ
jgi:hypothetical protein